MSILVNRPHDAPDHFDFRPVGPQDIALLHEWMGQPHVVEWWGPQPTIVEVRAHYLFDRRPSAPHAYVAYSDGAPVGFVQTYVAAAAGDGWWPDVKDPGVVGIDQFLAHADQLGHGIGTRLVRVLVGRLFADPAVTRVHTDPSPDNQRAIRCYEKAGFRRVEQVITPDGPALLMAVDRPVVSDAYRSSLLDETARR
jgi:RimJ/RimL family protein N-acetyltransferase